jgi:hypothetical protein
MYRVIRFFLLIILINCLHRANGQNIFSGERVQVVGAFNGYVTTPYGTDYRTMTYQRMTVTSGNPIDGRGQWQTTINVQNVGGNVPPINMPGGGSNGFLFISGPAANRFQNKWVFSGVGQGTVDGINNISAFNSGNDMGLNMSTTGYYTFIFNDCGYTQTNGRYYVGYTSAAPVQPSRQSEVFNPDGTATINISTPSTPSAEEKIYVRYVVNGDFSGITATGIVQASGSGTSFSATIPAQTNGAVVRYYVFTSTRTLAQLTAHTEAERSLARLRFDDNSGATYSYIAGALPVIIRYFNGSSSDVAIGLVWGIEQETNMLQYELYKSGNGVAFTLLETFPARQNNNSSVEYRYVDVNPSSSGNYYKIICVSRDGKRVSSKILKVNFLAINNRLTIYPNPVAGQLNVSIAALNRGEYRMNVFNDAGQLVYTQPYSHNGFDKTLHLVLPATIKKGPYRLYISNKYEFHKGTFIVQ